MAKKERVTSTEKLKKRLKDDGDIFECLGEFKGSQVKIKFNKKSCNHKAFFATPNNILKGTYNCPTCGHESRVRTKRRNSPITLDHVKQTLKESYFDPDRYTLLEGQVYINNKKNMDVHCNVCDKVFGVSLVNMRQGRGCPHCNAIFDGRKPSVNSLKIKRYLDDNDFNYEEEYRIDECRNIRPLPFDFAVWVNNQLILIEYDGEQHFKPFNKKLQSSVKALRDLKVNDKIKIDFCKENNIPLIIIDYRSKNVEHEVEEKLDSVIQRLSLGSENLQ